MCTDVFACPVGTSCVVEDVCGLSLSTALCGVCVCVLWLRQHSCTALAVVRDTTDASSRLMCLDRRGQAREAAGNTRDMCRYVR